MMIWNREKQANLRISVAATIQCLVFLHDKWLKLLIIKTVINKISVNQFILSNHFSADGRVFKWNGLKLKPSETFKSFLETKLWTAPTLDLEQKQRLQQPLCKWYVYRLFIMSLSSHTQPPRHDSRWPTMQRELFFFFPRTWACRLVLSQWKTPSA